MTSGVPFGAFTALERKIEAMNELPELPRALLQPISVDEMNWLAFREYTGCSQRTITYCKMHFRLMRPKSMRQLIYMIVQFFQKAEVCDLVHIWAKVGTLLAKTGPQVRVMYKNYVDCLGGNVKAKGRPRTLTEEQVQVLVQQVNMNFAEKHPMTKRDLMIFIYEQWHVEVSKRFVTRLVSERREITQVDAFPMEFHRAAVTSDELSNFYDQLREIIKDVHPRNIFNVDEIGFCRKSRHQKLRCIAPACAIGQRVEYIPQPDVDKTFTLIATITLDGDRLKPMIVCPVKSLPKDFLSTEVWNGKDCIIQYSESGFANKSILNKWYDEVLVPQLKQNRGDMGMRAPAVLLCDGFRAHNDPELLAKAAKDNVRIVFIPPHSSHLTQALDKFAFANMKKEYQLCTGVSSTDRNGKKIKKMLHAYYSSLTPMTVRASWGAVGIHLSWDDRGENPNIVVDGGEVTTSHANLEARTGQRRRTPITDHHMNRLQLDRVERGQCPLCGHGMTRQDEPRHIIYLRRHRQEVPQE